MNPPVGLRCSSGGFPPRLLFFAAYGEASQYWTICDGWTPTATANGTIPPNFLIKCWHWLNGGFAAATARSHSLSCALIRVAREAMARRAMTVVPLPGDRVDKSSQSSEP